MSPAGPVPAATALAEPDLRVGVLKAPEAAAGGTKTLVIEEEGTAKVYKAPAAAYTGTNPIAGVRVWFVVAAGADASGLADLVHPQVSPVAATRDGSAPGAAP